MGFDRVCSVPPSTLRPRQVWQHSVKLGIFSLSLPQCPRRIQCGTAPSRLLHPDLQPILRPVSTQEHGKQEGFNLRFPIHVVTVVALERLWFGYTRLINQSQFGRGVFFVSSDC